MSEEKKLSKMLDEIFSDYILNNEEQNSAPGFIPKPQPEPSEYIFSMPKSEEKKMSVKTVQKDEIPMPQIIEPVPPIAPPLVPMPYFEKDSANESVIGFKPYSKEYEALNILPPYAQKTSGKPLQNDIGPAMEAMAIPEINPKAKEKIDDMDFETYETGRSVYLALEIYDKLMELSLIYLKLLRITRNPYNKRILMELRNDISGMMQISQYVYEKFANHNLDFYDKKNMPASNNYMTLINDAKQNIKVIEDNIEKLQSVAFDERLKNQLNILSSMMQKQEASIKNLMYK